MARYAIELPNEEIQALQKLDANVPKIIGEMLEAGGNVVLQGVKGNLSRAFKSPAAIANGLRLTRVYHNSDGGTSIKIGFYGTHRGRKSKKYPAGVPIALIASAREYGTSSGEKSKPFFRKEFRRKPSIDAAMQAVHDKYIKD